MTTAAKAFPQRFPTALISLINLSTPSKTATVTIGIAPPIAPSVPARTINPEPVTPPLDENGNPMQGYQHGAPTPEGAGGGGPPQQ
jgi:hypothetical protein